MACLLLTPEIEKLRKSFPKETLSSLKNVIGIYQERLYDKMQDMSAYDTIPSIEELTDIINDVRQEIDHYTQKISKEEMEQFLQEGNIPENIQKLATNLGVEISINKKTKTLKITGSTQNIKFFRALATDLMEDEKIAESAFGLSARERLDAIINWAKFASSGDYAAMSNSIQIAKKHLYQDHNISDDTMLEYLRKQALENMSIKEMNDRKLDIVYQFSKILSKYHQEALDKLSEEADHLNTLIKNNDKGEYEDFATAKKIYEKRLGEIQDELSSRTRLDTLKQITAGRILNDIKDMFLKATEPMSDDDFAEYISSTFNNASSDIIKRNITMFRGFVKGAADNFTVLATDAIREIEARELIHISYVERSLSEEDISTTEDTEKDASDVLEDERQYLENWQFEFDTSSNWSKMSATVRQVLCNCKLGIRTTHFGTPRTVPVMQVVNTLIKELVGISNSNDMMDMLLMRKYSYPWMEYIYNEAKSNSQFKTQLWRCTHRVSQKLDIVLANPKDVKNMRANRAMPINKAKTQCAIYQALVNQWYSGVPINKETSVFDEEGLNIDNINKILEKFDFEYPEDITRHLKYTFGGSLDEHRRLRREYPNLLSDVTEMLNAFGFAVTKDDVNAACVIWTAAERSRPLLQEFLLGSRSMAQELYAIYSNDGTIDDVFSSRGIGKGKAQIIAQSFSELLTYVDDGEIEPSVRENGKTRYTYVMPSTLDEFMLGIQSERWVRDKETGKLDRQGSNRYLEERYGKDPHYVYYDAEGTMHFYNPVLDSIYSNHTGAQDYVTVLTTSVGRRRKVEQKNLKQRDRLDLMWAMAHQSENAAEEYERYALTWFPIPLPSDSGRMVFLALGSSITFIGEAAKRTIKQFITLELERMLETNIAHLPKEYQQNAKKFCYFPLLNNPSLNGGYTVETLISYYKTSKKDAQFMNFDSVMNELVEAVYSGMINKFKEENADFYYEIMKEDAKKAEKFIISSSIAQLCFNDLFNGDPAFYNGYTDLQKRSKQNTVPLDHMDIGNDDFLEDYKRQRGIASDTELSEGDITERVLYLNDPIVASNSKRDIQKLYDRALADGRISREMYDTFISEISEIKYTDGQAFRSFESCIMIMYALGEMKKGDALDLALHRIAEGKQTPEDFNIILTARKPFLSGLIKTQNPDGTERLIPVQHKMAEQVLTAALVQAQMTELGKSNALTALAQVMKEQKVDVVMFSSAVKVGNNGAVDFEDIDVETASVEEIKAQIYKQMAAYNQTANQSIVHSIPYSLWGIVAQNANEDIDSDDISFGVQLQKLITTDLPDTIMSDGKIVKAKYNVEGVGELTKDEILKLYNKLVTEKMLRAYHELTGVFADKQKLSEKLQLACKNSSRNAAYLERAFSLDENGNFVIPLGDLSLITLSSEFLQSLVKNAVSKVKLPGKNLVSCTCFGVANKLKLEFEYDEFGEPIAYKGIDCLLPAWSKDIVEVCMREDGTLDFEKIKEQAPELLDLLGTRIPTQFKNFVLPLHCVGFLPTILGNTIITAMDSVSLQDADFDNDKIVTYLPNIRTERYVDNWKDLLHDAYRNYTNSFYDFDKMYEVYSMAKEEMRNSEGETAEYFTFKEFVSQQFDDEELLNFYRRKDAPEGNPISFSEYKKLHKDDYLRKDGPKVSAISEADNIDNISDISDKALDNLIVKTMIGMLTSEAVSTMALASGSTAELKKIKAEIESLKPKSAYPDSPSDLSTRAGFETRNNDGKQMIAVFANAESMQALAQSTRLAIRDKKAVTINGRTLTSLHDVNIENSLEYISKYIGEALGAAADNAKDPMLSVFNFNLTTAPVVSLMLQLGYTVEEIALFLNIPSIREYTDTGYTDIELDEWKEYRTLPGDLSDIRKVVSFNGTFADMDTDMKNYCIQAFGVYMHLAKLGERLRTFSSLVRGDSGSSMPHGSVENILSRILQYDQFLEEEAGLNGAFENYRDLLDIDYEGQISSAHVDKAKNPIAQAYLDYGIVASYQFLKEHYPALSDKNFRDIIRQIIRECYNGRITPKTVKPIMLQLLSYIESQYDCMCKEGMSFEESRNYYINVFPLEALKILSKYPKILNTTLFKRLKFYSDSQEAEPFISLQGDAGLVPMVRDKFTSDWQALFYYKNEDGTPNKEVQQVALDLFKYCFYRNGFAFQGDSFSHLAPTEARLFFPGYADMFEQMKKPFASDVYKNFRIQYLRNHFYDYRICKSGNRKVPRIWGWIDTKANAPKEVVILPSKVRLDDEFRTGAYDWYFNETDNGYESIPAFVYYEMSKTYFYVKADYNETTGETTYVLTTPLGWKKKATEYYANTGAFTIQSIYDQTVVSGELKAKRRKKSRGNYTSKASTFDRTFVEDLNDDIEDSPRPKKKSSSKKDGHMTQEEINAFWGITPKKKSSSRSVKGKASAKSKKQVAKEKAKTTSKKITYVKDQSVNSGIPTVEQACASGYNTYTICIHAVYDVQYPSLVRRGAINNNHCIFAYPKNRLTDVVSDLKDALKKKTNKHITLNVTGSPITLLSQTVSQETMDEMVESLFDLIKKNKIYVDKVVSTAQPGFALAAARAAKKKGYMLELHPTADYQVMTEDGVEKSKDLFEKNLGGSVSAEYKKESQVYDKEDGIFIEANNPWTREIASKDSKTLYIFTDNTERTSGSNRIAGTTRYAQKYSNGRHLSYPTVTSAVIRGLENAFPISTQKTYSPSDPAAGRWEDSDLKEFRQTIQSEILAIIEAFESGNYKRVVFPEGGFFDRKISDISEERTPKLHRELEMQLQYLETVLDGIADSGEIYTSGVDDIDETEKLSASNIILPKTYGKTNVVMAFTSEQTGSSEFFTESGDSLGNKIFVIGNSIFETVPNVDELKKCKFIDAEGRLITEPIYVNVISGNGRGQHKVTDAIFGKASYLKMVTNCKVMNADENSQLNKDLSMEWFDDNNEVIC